MDRLTELAKAKINLCLRVLGRRADGYHQLESLVAFAEIGDRLTLEPADAFSLEVEGRFADRLDGRNIVERAVEYYGFSNPGNSNATIRLEKRLPVAGGVGGGSADAAAALRLLARFNGDIGMQDGYFELARSLGADVSVCMESKPALMWGRGDCLKPLQSFPRIPAVLVNPGVKLATVDVFSALQAPDWNGPDEPPLPDAPLTFETFEEVADYANAIGNDLQDAACRLAPEIAAVQLAMRQTMGCLLVQLSGSGPTCVGLYCDKRHAAMAAANIGLNPDWWVAETTLG
jgi:4-diphosphocytidyl-2-C-methyl-D-erythritol kinase